MKSRVERIFQQLGEGIDAVIFMNATEPNIDLSFFYITGAESGIFEGCSSIIWPDGRMELIVSELEETSSRRVSAEIKTFKTTEQRAELLKESLNGVKTLGINGAALTYGNLKKLKETVPDFTEVDISKTVEMVRMIKDEEEVERIRKACQIASRVADDIPNFLKEGMRESEVGAEISYRMQRLGASGPSFDMIAAFGENSAEPHYLAGDRPLNRGEVALFDFGALYRKYCSDITRTFFAREASEKQERIYELVRDANELALTTIRAGIPAKEADAAARELIDSTEFKGRFIHSLGHGLGLSVHDGGSMSPVTDIVLQENMILTVEPGIYIPGFGGVRIEDDVRITKEGCEVLTNASKELMVI
ncbi:MAG: aminopeptidase P family protein [Methanomassiliicoccales archaeon]|nr:aminopeptidase P family protein [Methanomassiliicoccales archaeon]NYT14370.1 aminopeptidase P family protein [Methanomassiliicoccales archaeon]